MKTCHLALFPHIRHTNTTIHSKLITHFPLFYTNSPFPSKPTLFPYYASPLFSFGCHQSPVHYIHASSFVALSFACAALLFFSIACSCPPLLWHTILLSGGTPAIDPFLSICTVIVLLYISLDNWTMGHCLLSSPLFVFFRLCVFPTLSPRISPHHMI